MQQIKNLLFAFLGWLLLLFFKGYTLGIEDQQELLPYVLYLKNKALYSGDFFIQSLGKIAPNERLFFAWALTPLIPTFEYSLLILHAAATIVLLLGMHRIAGLFITQSYWAWACVYSSLIVFYLYTLGGCELYYNAFQASNLAKAIGIWAIYFFLQERYTLCFILLSIITYVQIIVGLDTTLLLLGVLLLQKKYKTLFTQSAIYAVVAGIYLIWIVKARSIEQPLDASLFYTLLFEFRHPHHFILSYFGLKHVIFFTVATCTGIVFYFSRHQTLFHFIILSSFGFILYYLSVEHFRFTPVANLNFYKMSIWIKFFGLIALFSLMEPKVYAFDAVRWFDNKLPAVLLLIPILFYGLVMTNHFNLLNKPLMIGNRIIEDPQIDIALKIKQNIPKDALFIVPYDATGFKYWSERNTYVDFKANTRTPAFMEEWHRRIGLVYNLSNQDKQKGFDLRGKANDFYNHHTTATLAPLISQGVTHILLARENPFAQSHQAIVENKFWGVYALKK
jgi:hypothetical protein